MVKQRLTSADCAAEVACLKKSIMGLRVANIYDINPKVRAEGVTCCSWLYMLCACGSWPCVCVCAWLLSALDLMTSRRLQCPRLQPHHSLAFGLLGAYVPVCVCDPPDLCAQACKKRHRRCQGAAPAGERSPLPHHRGVCMCVCVYLCARLCYLLFLGWLSGVRGCLTEDQGQSRDHEDSDCESGSTAC